MSHDHSIWSNGDLRGQLAFWEEISAHMRARIDAAQYFLRASDAEIAALEKRLAEKEAETDE